MRRAAMRFLRDVCSWAKWAVSVAMIFGLVATASQASPQTQPTKSQDAQAIDQTWQHASSKYDSERQKLLKEVHRRASDGPYRADWESLQKYEAPDWYKDAKFGIFIHWGVYSVPAYGNEWYPRNMYR